MDLAGKSTAIKALQAREPFALVRHLSLSEGNELYAQAKLINRLGVYSSDTVGTMYLAAIKADLESHATASGVVLQDSIGLLRSLAHHTTLGNQLLVDHLHGLARVHPRFSHAFVFTASIRVRQARLQKRMLESPKTISNADRLVLHNAELFRQMDAVIIENATRYFDATVVDTSQMSIADVEEYVCAQVYS